MLRAGYSKVLCSVLVTAQYGYVFRAGYSKVLSSVLATELNTGHVFRVGYSKATHLVLLTVNIQMHVKLLYWPMLQMDSELLRPIC